MKNGHRCWKCGQWTNDGETRSCDCGDPPKATQEPLGSDRNERRRSARFRVERRSTTERVATLEQEIATLREQLKEAREKALEEAGGILGMMTMYTIHPVHPMYAVGWNEALEHAAENISKLKETK